MLSFIFFCILCAASAHFVGALLPFLIRRAVRLGLTDLPDERKVHARPVPPIGGIVIMPVFLILLPVLGFTALADVPLYLALALLLVMGWYDDHYGLAAHWKLLGQIAAALIVAVPGTVLLPHLGHLFGVDHVVELQWLALPFTAVCLIFLINAMNMIDGVDGLAGGVSFVMLGALALAALRGDDLMYASAACVMMALLFGFLLHNMRYPGHKRATVFLGDAGSMSLGLIIAWLAIGIASDPTPGLVPIGAAWVIALPIIDAFALFVARKRAGRRAFEPGRDHLHHRLLAKGLTPGQVTMMMMGIAAIFGAYGLWGGLIGAGEGVQTWTWLVLLALYTARLVMRTRTLYTPAIEA